MPIVDRMPSTGKRRVVVGVNTLTSVDQAVYSNHCQFWYRLGRSYPDFDFILCNPRRMSIDHMRNMVAKIALENEAEYIMFIDDDVLVPIDALARLIETGADIAAGWTIIRGYPFKNMFFEFVPESNGTALRNWDGPEINGLMKCDAVGFSCALIKVELLRKVKAPYFVTGPYNTEDIYFCMKAKEALGADLKIVVDLDVKTSHCLGNEYMDPLNKFAYKKYVEELNPTLSEQKEPEPEIKATDDLDENPMSYEQVLKDAVFGPAYE